ncbi:MAG: hypothetical protein E6J42_00585 [Chloroflexi bacterium]|nr:MAG: hypothetical protein E6J42_00585 [Chloroflexota bacterium]
MSLRLYAIAGAAVLAAVFALGGYMQTASAHEARGVGKYQFIVGFLNEPSIAFQPNGLSLEIKFFENGAPTATGEEAESAQGGTPVENADSSLKAEVIVGGGAKKMDLTLEPRFGEPGAYDGHFIPTLAGDYTFHITGKLEDQNIDESFSSGPKTFDTVQDASALEFPNTVPDNGQLGQKIDALSSKVDNIKTGGSDDTAKVLGIVGIIIGIVALGAGGYAVASRRQT